MFLPSGESAVSHNAENIWPLSVLDIVLTGICASSMILVTFTYHRVYHSKCSVTSREQWNKSMPPTLARFVFVFGGCLSRVLSFCWVTTAAVTLCEHCVAVGTAADSLRHMLVRTLCPILDSSSSKWYNFCLCLGYFGSLVCRSSLEQRALTTASRFQKNLQYWLTVIQAMIGKLYVLSLFYIM